CSLEYLHLSKLRKKVDFGWHGAPGSALNGLERIWASAPAVLRVHFSAACQSVLPQPARYQFGGAEVSMLIEIRELEAHAVDFDEQLQPGVIDLGAEIRQSGDLKSNGRAQLVRE